MDCKVCTGVHWLSPATRRHWWSLWHWRLHFLSHLPKSSLYCQLALHWNNSKWNCQGSPLGWCWWHHTFHTPSEYSYTEDSCYYLKYHFFSRDAMITSIFFFASFSSFSYAKSWPLDLLSATFLTSSTFLISAIFYTSATFLTSGTFLISLTFLTCYFSSFLI